MRTVFSVYFLFLAVMVFCQKPQKPTTSEILSQIQKLNVLGSVLYVAAHPDDENTRLIAYLSKEKHYDVTYLSLTRGDGGQNLIGTELRELLGVLRSQELLMARSIDGGKQLFGRANDFGFSKNPTETLQIWERDQVLSDVVQAMRSTQPDVVINRFYHEEKYPTHGHHTASAMLSMEAFDLAARANCYPEQIPTLGLWQPKRLFFNTSWFFFGNRETFEKLDKSHLHKVDVGVYSPLLGKSITEIAAEARSQHKCQGFGMLSTRGSSFEYLEHLKGSKPKAQSDLLEGINTTWTRLEGGAKVGKLLKKIEKNFDLTKPEASVADLLLALTMIENLPQSYWKTKKLAEIKTVIKACLGLYLEASTTETLVTPSDSLSIRFEAINRSGIPLSIDKIALQPGIWDTLPKMPMKQNELFQLNKKILVPAKANLTAPYWLLEPWSVGMYTVQNFDLLGKPETPHYFSVSWEIVLGGKRMVLDEEMYYKTGEPAIGEVFAPIEVIPPALVSFDKSAIYSAKSKESITVSVKSGKPNANGTVRLLVPKDWKVEPAQHQFAIAQKGGQASFQFEVSPVAGAQSEILTSVAEMDGKTYSSSLTEIKYDHIPPQSVLLPSRLRFTPLNVKCTAKQVGYYLGAGDQVAESLEQIGCKVTQLTDLDIQPQNLAKFDCILIGIRAYNTKDALKYHNKILLDYVAAGGTLILQYNTNHELVLPEFAPFKLKLGRGRVTEENAPVTILAPEHSVLNTPNKIVASDFDGWVQERGLYFPSEWGPEFAPLIGCKDTGEKNREDGAILIANHGKGKYIYTGLSFFRELPEGVPGPMRILANLMSAGTSSK
jgi:LmbE family N-acetylglucosaminyl deacetylase